MSEDRDEYAVIEDCEQNETWMVLPSASVVPVCARSSAVES